VLEKHTDNGISLCLEGLELRGYWKSMLSCLGIFIYFLIVAIYKKGTNGARTHSILMTFICGTEKTFGSIVKFITIIKPVNEYFGKET